MHIHYENELLEHTEMHTLHVSSWRYSETKLEHILISHGQGDALYGDRFLVGRLRWQITLEGQQPDIIIHDYILTRNSEGWEHHCAIYIDQTPYDYDFDVFEMRPIEELRSVS